MAAMKLMVFGDDLTGCNAEAVLFRNLGWRVRTLLRYDQPLPLPTGEATIWNTGTRLLRPDKAAARVKAMIHEVVRRWGKDTLFAKRIDSTFRGPIGFEAEAMMRAIPEDAVGVVVAAFPASGRCVCDGRLYVDGTPVDQTEIASDPHTPVTTSDIVELLRRQTALPIIHFYVDDVAAEPRQLEERVTRLARGRCFVVCDAMSDADIETLAQCFAQWKRPVLPIDPGPFTVHYLSARQRSRNRILVVSGSRMPTTSAQLDHLEREFSIRLLDLDVEALADESRRHEYVSQVAHILGEAAGKASVVGIRTDRAQVQRQLTPIDVSTAIAELTERILNITPISGLYLTGGEVAYEVLHRLNAEALEPLMEICPLCILSRIVSGPYQDFRVVTKGGSVGPPSVIADSVNVLLSGS
jgi:uncharacterized protein YgbK (DUF1537 family)